MTELTVTTREDGSGYGFAATTDVTQVEGSQDLVRGRYVMGSADEDETEVYEFDGELEVFYWNSGRGHIDIDRDA
jgi:deoxyribodipyrimidine photolyase-like uncharacterized protein